MTLFVDEEVEMVNIKYVDVNVRRHIDVLDLKFTQVL